jgi:predicted adenylyl cyclase CyaB
MARNVEIKASLETLDEIALKVSAIATKGPVEIYQDDTFFHCPNGRLKLRAFSFNQGELIFYQRANASGPKESFYVRTATADPQGLRECLSLAYTNIGRVIKRRTLYLVGRTRVHLDLVEQLGAFVELEVVLGEAESVEAGALEAARIMGLLGIEKTQLIETAYLDLLELKRSDSPKTSHP